MSSSVAASTLCFMITKSNGEVITDAN
jgi:hypothetical protein